MADKLQQAILKLEQLDLRHAVDTNIDFRALTSVTAVYLISMLSVPLTEPATLLMFAVFPILFSSFGPMGYGGLLCRSSVVLPFVILIGIFNPLIDREPMLHIGKLIISRGWVTFFSIMVRGVLSVQAVLLLIYTCGPLGLCRTLQRMGFPIVLTSLIALIYRYMFVLLREAQQLKIAIASRSYGRTSWPLRLWARIVTLLLIRATERSEHIHMAMLARGFDGRLHDRTEHRRLSSRDLRFMILWSVAIIGLRILS